MHLSQGCVVSGAGASPDMPGELYGHEHGLQNGTPDTPDGVGERTGLFQHPYRAALQTHYRRRPERCQERRQLTLSCR